MSRFDYTKFDDRSADKQQAFKGMAAVLEMGIDTVLTSPRAKGKALDALEECYMWIGKAIRDDQIARGGDD